MDDLDFNVLEEAEPESVEFMEEPIIAAAAEAVLEEEPGAIPAPAPEPAAPAPRAPPREIIQIREFDPNLIHPLSLAPEETGSKCVIIGKPGSGKSYLLDYLIYTKKHIFPAAMIISGTEESNKFFSRRFPDLFIHSEMDLKKLQNFKQRQRVAKELLPNPWAMCILDDCMDDNKYFRTPVLSGFFKNGRHWKCNLYIAMQYAVDIPPALRTCVDYSFIFREPTERTRKILYENYASVIPSWTMFNDMMDQLTQDYTCLVIVNRTTSTDFRDCVFYLRAPKVPDDFVFGSEDYLRFAEKRYDVNRPLFF